jgi:FkbM family methyltransferase
LGATVFAVEMQPTLIPIIQLNAALNDLWTVHPICAAMAEAPGLASVGRVSPSPGMQNSDGLVGQMVPAIGSLNHDWVPKLTLDGLFAGAPRPDLVKVDVEGAEGVVLAGAGKLIEAAETRFVIEVHSHLIERFGTRLEDLLAPFDAERWHLFELAADGPRPLSRDAFLALAQGVVAGSKNLPVLLEPIASQSGSE